MGRAGSGRAPTAAARGGRHGPRRRMYAHPTGRAGSGHAPTAAARDGRRRPRRCRWSHSMGRAGSGRAPTAATRGGRHRPRRCRSNPQKNAGACKHPHSTTLSWLCRTACRRVSLLQRSPRSTRHGSRCTQPRAAASPRLPPGPGRPLRCNLATGERRKADMAQTWTTIGALGPTLAESGGTGTATRTRRHAASMRAAACGWSIAVSTSTKTSSGKLVRSTSSTHALGSLALAGVPVWVATARVPVVAATRRGAALEARPHLRSPTLLLTPRPSCSAAASAGFQSMAISTIEQLTPMKRGNSAATSCSELAKWKPTLHHYVRFHAPSDHGPHMQRTAHLHRAPAHPRTPRVGCIRLGRAAERARWRSRI